MTDNVEEIGEVGPAFWDTFWAELLAEMLTAALDFYAAAIQEHSAFDDTETMTDTEGSKFADGLAGYHQKETEAAAEALNETMRSFQKELADEGNVPFRTTSDAHLIKAWDAIVKAGMKHLDDGEESYIRRKFGNLTNPLQENNEGNE